MRSPASMRRGAVALIAGLVTLALGLAAMAAIVAVAYGASAESWTWSYRMGLPGSLLASAMAQALILTGARLCWGRRRPRR